MPVCKRVGPRRAASGCVESGLAASSRVVSRLSQSRVLGQDLGPEPSRAMARASGRAPASCRLRVLADVQRCNCRWRGPAVCLAKFKLSRLPDYGWSSIVAIASRTTLPRSHTTLPRSHTTRSHASHLDRTSSTSRPWPARPPLAGPTLLFSTGPSEVPPATRPSRGCAAQV